MEIHCVASAVMILLHSLSVAMVSANLIIYHGRVSNDGVRFDRTVGVAALDIGGPSTHTFDCLREGSTSVVNLEWQVNDMIPRFSSSNEEIFLDGDDIAVRRLNLAPVQGPPAGSNDVGTYTCVDTANGDSLSILVVAGAVAICAADPNREECVVGGQTPELVILPGNPATFQVYTDGDPALTPMEISWTFLGPRSSLQDGNQRLVIESVALEDSGVYMVEVVRMVRGTTQRAMTMFNLDVHVGVTVFHSPSPTTALEHASVTLTCGFQGNPAPTITWEREGSAGLPPVTRMATATESMKSENITLFTVTSSFTIRNVLYEDQGRYRCIAANILIDGVQRSATSDFAGLMVTPRLQLTATDPNDIDNGLVSVTTGSYVEILCSGSGNLTWESSTGATITETTLLHPPFNVYQTHDPTNNMQRLVIQEFSPNDIALYTCRTNLTANGNTFAESVYISSSDPAVFITEEIVFAAENSSAEISATVFTSDLNSLVIEWYHEGTLIDAASDPRYSVSAEGMSLHILNIARVEAALLGRYQVVVSTGDRNQSDAVELAFPDLPTVSVVPVSRTVTEGETASFQCEASGNEPTVFWTLFGNQPLPSGVVQSGSTLIFTQVSRDNAGRYQCTVSNGAGETTGFANLTVLYSPMATITGEQMATVSVSGVLKVVAEEGDPGPAFTCSGDGFPVPGSIWGGQNGGVTFPSGVSRVEEMQNSVLLWARALQYTDSGNYTCNAANSAGTSSATLELLVRRAPTIVSIYPTFPVITSSSSLLSSFIYEVPLGYQGTVVTCAALGWLTPAVEWMKDNGTLVESRMVSDAVQNPNRAFVLARLRWIDGFLESDAGDYTCVVRASDTDAVSYHVISLELQTEPPPPTLPPPLCSVSSGEVSFEVRVLDTDCSTWEEELVADITRDFMNALVSISSAACQDCVVTSQNIRVAGVSCSEDGAALFSGTVLTGDSSRTTNIICTLTQWQQSGPQVIINGNYVLVDSSLRLLAALGTTASTAASTAAPQTKPPADPPLVIIVGASVGGVVVLLVLIVVVACCCFVRSLRKRSGHQPSSIYDRTRQITPETKAPFDTSGEENQYSTLVRDEIHPLPPKNAFPSHEIELTRINSRSLLLSEDSYDGKGSTPSFQVLNRRSSGQIPQDYQVAVSSMENLCDIGNTPEEMRRNSSDLVFNCHGSASQLTEFSFVGETNSGQYERVQRASPSTRVLPGHGGKRGSTLPANMSSTGNIMTRGTPPSTRMELRRHTSALDAAPDDYARLDHTTGRVPQSRRGSRGTSTSSMASSIHSQHFPLLSRQYRSLSRDSESPPLPARNSLPQLAQISKRPSITRESESPPLPARNSQPLTPNSKATPSYNSEEPPPSYNDVMSPVSSAGSPFSPSAASMITNGAYEGVAPHKPAPKDIVADTNMDGSQGSPNDKPWMRNVSDSILWINPQESVSSSTITPYSQVSNFEIDSRMMEASRTGAESDAVPRFSITGKGGALPYVEAIDGGVESPSAVPAPQGQVNQATTV